MFALELGLLLGGEKVEMAVGTHKTYPEKFSLLVCSLLGFFEAKSTQKCENSPLSCGF